MQHERSPQEPESAGYAPVMRAWWVTVCGMTMSYRGRTRSRARYLAAKDCHAAGWGDSLGDVLKTARTQCAPQHDGDHSEGSVPGSFTERPPQDAPSGEVKGESR